MNRALQILQDRAVRFADVLSDLSGYAAMRVPLQKACRPGEVTLDLAGYRQVNSYSCGAVAAAMIAKWFRPGLSFDRVYAAVHPSPESGAGALQVTRALRALGIHVSRKTNLSFPAICHAIDAGQPILVCLRTSRADTNHWVVLYGYGRRPRLVFVAGRGLPFIGRQRLKWRVFREL